MINIKIYKDFKKNKCTPTHANLGILGAEEALVAQEGAPFGLGQRQPLAREIDHRMEARRQR